MKERRQRKIHIENKDEKIKKERNIFIKRKEWERQRKVRIKW